MVQQLIEDAVMQVRDQKLWDEMEAQQTEDKLYLEALVEGDPDFPRDEGLT